ncbi:MAG TPA: peptidylprolyl isomerase [Candidatus Solibacter sp.]|nr:peptidylprolyl isomerase [Candidatus Solibacter sp.]
MKRLSTLFLIAMSAFAQTPAAPPKKDAAPAAPAREPGLYAIFNTSMGTFTAKLFENETPITVKNFVALAKGTKAWKDPNTKAMVTKPLYNGVTFHRVIKGFMIQTGDPTARGDHDCGFTIKDEFVPSLKFDQPFMLGMANIGSPNTGACQFFVTAAPTPHLNNMHTIFGKVVEGTDVVMNIDNVRTGANDKPVTPVKIVSVTIQRVGPAPAAPAPVKKSTAPTKSGTTTKSGVTPKK